MVERWVRDLVITKTFTGLRFQEAILNKLSKLKKKPYRLATAEEESKGIDGFIGDFPVSVKPTTYSSKKMLPESIQVSMIYYEKKKDGIVITFNF